MNRIFRRLARAVIIIFAAGLLIPLQSNARQVVLNEVMASNSTTIADEDGDFPDWIELFNAGGTPVSLAGYGLSDTYGNPFRWVLPDTTLAPGAFLLVWASSKDRGVPGRPLHTNFAISASGEEVLLTAPDGTRVDELEPVTIPTDISLGRQPDGTGAWYFFEEPTPGSANIGTGYQALLSPVSYSHDAGFYTGEITLTLGSPDENVRIVYTLDGSEPGEDAPEYTAPIVIRDRLTDPNTISMIPTNFMQPGSEADNTFREAWREPSGFVAKGTVVRARALREGARPGDVTTRSFFVWPEGVERYSLPVFSLSTDPDHFFSAETGIYIPGDNNNMFQRGEEWERPIHIEFWEADGTPAFSQGAGARIHGGSTRSRPRKSLRIYARGEYGESWFNYPLFPDKPVERYKRFLLRNSGNDWSEAVFRDAFHQSLLRGNTRLGIQYGRPAIVFLNGEYWGIHWIRDRLDQHYLSTHYGVEEHEMTMLENERVYDRGDPAGISHFNEFWNFITNPNNPMSQPINYANVVTYIDPESFRDHFIANIFFGNTDWPGNHQLYWRKNVPYSPDAPYGHDGRWRWMIFDTDFGFWLDFFYVTGHEVGPAHNTLAMALVAGSNNWPNYDWSTAIFRRLVTNSGFRADFVNRFADLLNTSFSAEYVLGEIDRFQAWINPEMDEHIRRWGRPLTRADWEGEVQRMRDYGALRPGFIRQHLRSQFFLGGDAELSVDLVDPLAGRVQVNSILLDPSTQGIGDEFASWRGTYFQGVPVTLSAIPNRGWLFTGWEGDVTSAESVITLNLTGDTNLVPVFERDDTVPADPMNPVAFRLADGDYTFTSWSPDEPDGAFPPNMVFVQSSMNDPGLGDEMTGVYHIPESDYQDDDLATIGFPYNNTRRTRINGLGEGGISFINTGRGRDLGAAVLALDTREAGQVRVEWTGGTVTPNSRVYAIRLQYRVGTDAGFTDLTANVTNGIGAGAGAGKDVGSGAGGNAGGGDGVSEGYGNGKGGSGSYGTGGSSNGDGVGSGYGSDGDGTPVEYRRSAVPGHEQRIGPVALPEEVLGQPYVQLRWKYYFTGERLSTESGARDELRLDDILVTTAPAVSVRDEERMLPEAFTIGQNYPNPFNPATIIPFSLNKRAAVRVEIFDRIGRRLATLADNTMEAGRHTLRFDATGFSSGVYYYRVSAEFRDGVQLRETRAMVLLK